jgi:hypothetical protein
VLAVSPALKARNTGRFLGSSQDRAPAGSHRKRDGSQKCSGASRQLASFLKGASSDLPDLAGGGPVSLPGGAGVALSMSATGLVGGWLAAPTIALGMSVPAPSRSHTSVGRALICRQRLCAPSMARWTV